jgi:hypothetical protein
MSISSSQSPKFVTKDYLQVLTEKPWLQCPKLSWEAFFCKRSNAHLVAAANSRHDPEEWMAVYHECKRANRCDDIQTLMRLIHAQTRKVSLQNDQQRYNLARVQQIVPVAVSQRKASESMKQWEKNQDPEEYAE